MVITFIVTDFKRSFNTNLDVFVLGCLLSYFVWPFPRELVINLRMLICLEDPKKYSVLSYLLVVIVHVSDYFVF